MSQLSTKGGDIKKASSASSAVSYSDMRAEVSMARLVMSTGFCLHPIGSAPLQSQKARHAAQRAQNYVKDGGFSYAHGGLMTSHQLQPFSANHWRSTRFRIHSQLYIILAHGLEMARADLQ